MNELKTKTCRISLNPLGTTFKLHLLNPLHKLFTANGTKLCNNKFMGYPSNIGMVDTMVEAGRIEQFCAHAHSLSELKRAAELKRDATPRGALAI